MHPIYAQTSSKAPSARIVQSLLWLLTELSLMYAVIDLADQRLAEQAIS